MIAARWVSVIERGDDSGGGSGGGASADQPVERPDEDGAGRAAARRRGRRAGQAGGSAARRLAPEQADRVRARLLEPQAGVAKGAVQEQPRAELRLGIGPSSAPSAARWPAPARQHRPALDQDQLARDRHERADVADPVVLERRQGLEVGLGEGAERHGQDVEPARLDQRQEQPERAFELGDPDVGGRLRPTASPNRTRRGRPDVESTGDAVVIRWPRRRAAAARRPPGRAARPGSGSARRCGRCSPPPPRCAPTTSAWSRSRSRATPMPGSTPADAPDPRAVAPGRARTRCAAGRRCRPCRRRAGARRPGPPDRSTPAARSAATTSSPWRRSATCIASKSGQLGGGQPGRERRSLRVASRGRGGGAGSGGPCRPPGRP